MNDANTLTIDGRKVKIENERNLLELVRKADIDLPTFCYHSDLSVYGACRLCLVQVEGRGIQPACSTPPEPGMKVKTTTEEIREIRKISVELLLANHNSSCPTCGKSASCQLQSLARRLGIEKVRFKPTVRQEPVDRSSPSLVRDPSKCILCGDCVRVCSEIQGIGAIDFVHRGSKAAVVPAFGKDLDQVECVNCGQCAAICPTGALTPKSDIAAIWKELDNPKKKVVAQIAPAVRVALGEHFGKEPGMLSTGQMVAALRSLGFAKVYDTSFTADLTIVEETEEFLRRTTGEAPLPLFTSCCPGWVKFAEQYYPELLPNLSSCRSPQQMLGSLAKNNLPTQLGVERKDLIMVSIMPCTAKKFEARRPEFAVEGVPDVDYVMTTQELAHMIEQSGIQFDKLEPASMDMPMGFKTGAGVIFGNSGGVSEAVLRYAAEKVNGVKLDNPDFIDVRGDESRREVTVTLGGKPLKLIVVNGLKAARAVADEVRAGTCDASFIEVMACPGGCVGGAGQPVSRDPLCRSKRTRGLFDADKMLELHKSQDNHLVAQAYADTLGTPGSHKAHELLHTHYHSRRRMDTDGVTLNEAGDTPKVSVQVCVGTSCYLRGSQQLLQSVLKHIEDQKLKSDVSVEATFCFEKCDRGPTVSVNDKVLHKCTLKKACEAIDKAMIGAAQPA
jgi:NADH-quinone oxidoreductase subunit G